jgi:hypothetical protein
MAEVDGGGGGLAMDDVTFYCVFQPNFYFFHQFCNLI